MKVHSANELNNTASIMGPDMSPRSQNVRVGITDLSGRRLEQAQLVSSETTHLIVMRASTGAVLDRNCYIVDAEGTTYIVDYTLDPRVPREDMWLEVYCHVENGNPVNFVYGMDGGTF